jgi:hypothetical protein
VCIYLPLPHSTDGCRRAVVFVDITDPGYKGWLLPTYFANMRQQAALHFDVHTLAFHKDLSPEEKTEVMIGGGSFENLWVEYKP